MKQETKDLIWQWQQAKEAIKEAQLAEDALRTAVIGAVFCTAPLDEGTRTAEIADGAEIKVVQRYDRKIKTELYEAMVFSYPTPVRLKPDLDKKLYDKLDPDQKRHFDQCVETKPAKASLELKVKG